MCANRTFPTAVVDLQSEYFTGLVEACVLNNPVGDVILGNITGMCDQSIDGTGQLNFACPVQTRARTKDVSEVKSNCDTEENKSTSDVHMFDRFSDVAQRQKEDPTLKAWFDKVGKDCKDGISYEIVEDLLHRELSRDGITVSTLAVPQTLRDQVLSYAHEATLAGHAGYYKTLNRVQSQFSWPSMTVDIINFIKSCHVCQMKAPIGRDKPAPFQRMALIEEPFQRVVIDLVGPLPVTKNRYEYILTMVDMATTWAEATPLRKITADKVAEALFDMFTRVGFPKEIQSDRGQQFMSDLLHEFNTLSTIKHIFSTPYHPQTNGVVERFHSTLKNMLRKLAEESPSDWDKFLSAALFA